MKHGWNSVSDHCIHWKLATFCFGVCSWQSTSFKILPNWLYFLFSYLCHFIIRNDSRKKNLALTFYLTDDHSFGSRYIPSHFCLWWTNPLVRHVLGPKKGKNYHKNNIHMRICNLQFFYNQHEAIAIKKCEALKFSCKY